MAVGWVGCNGKTRKSGERGAILEVSGLATVVPVGVVDMERERALWDPVFYGFSFGL